MSGARATVTESVHHRGVDIVVSPIPGRVLVWEAISTPVAENVFPPREANLNLPDDVARALYEGLHRFYGGSPDAAFLKDLLAKEQARVDQFIESTLARPTVVVSGTSPRDVKVVGTD